MKDKLKLYLVTDSDILRGRDFYKCIENALKGGVTTIQLREKEASGKEFLEKAYKLRELTKQYNALFIINDRIDIAMLCDADGVHVGQSDIPVNDVRELVGNNKIIGVSVHNLEEAINAKKGGADYIGIGAMFNTTTKKDAKVVTLDTLKIIDENLDIPKVLIGGINLENIKMFRDVNVAGYAIVSAILKSDDIYNECIKWIDVL